MIIVQSENKAKSNYNECLKQVQLLYSAGIDPAPVENIILQHALELSQTGAMEEAFRHYEKSEVYYDKAIIILRSICLDAIDTQARNVFFFFSNLYYSFLTFFFFH